jgi:hypothetical protein
MVHMHCMLDTQDYGHTLIILNAFPLQQRLHKCTVMLRYMSIAYLVFCVISCYQTLTRAAHTDVADTRSVTRNFLLGQLEHMAPCPCT